MKNKVEEILNDVIRDHENKWKSWTDSDEGVSEHAERVVKLFALPDVSKRSELLFDFYKWQKENGCLYSDATQEYKMKNDIEEFIKSKL